MMYKTGPCRGSFKKYFYNGATGQCERFTYGGCKGNENNFDTKAECENRCGCDGCLTQFVSYFLDEINQ
jgi:hypothetical protein